MKFCKWFLWGLFLVLSLEEVIGADDTYNTIHRDGSYEFGYNNPDSYHYADANRNNIVKGEFSGRNPATGTFDTTVYTAGPRGFRPRGKNIVRKYDLNQAGPRPVGSPDDPNYDPFEDPSYNFSFKTRTYTRQENANRAGDVTGRYSYVDDVGERHNVEFIAGKNTGFHVKTPFPDSNPRAYGPLYFNGRGKPIPRGRTSIQRGLDGSYRFVSAGPDQRRTETSDATGHVRGSYTYLDDKGIQHSVHYIAGPGIGYRVLKTVKGPHLPTVFPFGRPEIIPPDFYDYEKDVFHTAASGHVKPGSGKPVSKEDGTDFDKQKGQDEFTFGNKKPVRPSSKPTFDRPSYTDEEETDDFGDLFGGGGTGTGGSGSTGGAGGSTTTARPSKPTSGQGPGAPAKPNEEDDGSYKPSSEEDGSYKPVPSKPTFGNVPRPGGLGITEDGSYKPRPTKPSYGNLPRPGGLGGIEDGSYKPRPTKPGYGDLPRPGGSTISALIPSTTSSGAKPSVVAGSNTDVDYGEGYGAGKPIIPEEGSNEVGDDFGLFGSESGNVRPPFGSRPVEPVSPTRPITPVRPVTPVRPTIHVGGTDVSCKKCAGTIINNVGDIPFTVLPGAPIRAHVQAIDLVPISPSVPSPSEQYKVETNMRTEQLNESSNQVFSTNSTEYKKEETVTETTMATTSVPNT